LAEFGKPRTMGPRPFDAARRHPHQQRPGRGSRGLDTAGQRNSEQPEEQSKSQPDAKTQRVDLADLPLGVPKLLVDRFQLAAGHADPDAITELHHQIVVSQQIDVPAPDVTVAYSPRDAATARTSFAE